MLLSLLSYWWFQYFLEPFLDVGWVIFLHHLSQHSYYFELLSQLSPKLWCFNGSSCISLCSWMAIILMLSFWALWTSWFNLAVLFKVWTLKVEINIARLPFNIGILCLVLANFLSAAISGNNRTRLLFIPVTVDAAWVLWNIIHHNFLSIADLIVDGRNTYQLSQCSPQNNSNSQPEYTGLYLPVSTTLAQLPAIQSSICLDPTLWPACLTCLPGKTCQKP